MGWGGGYGVSCVRARNRRKRTTPGGGHAGELEPFRFYTGGRDPSRIPRRRTAGGGGRRRGAITGHSRGCIASRKIHRPSTRPTSSPPATKFGGSHGLEAWSFARVIIHFAARATFNQQSWLFPSPTNLSTSRAGTFEETFHARRMKNIYCVRTFHVRVRRLPRGGNISSGRDFRFRKRNLRRGGGRAEVDSIFEEKIAGIFTGGEDVRGIGGGSWVSISLVKFQPLENTQRTTTAIFERIEDLSIARFV